MPNFHDSTSSSLIDRIKLDDQLAWSRFVELYAPLVYRWARRIGLSNEDAADVGQEVFRTVSGRVESFHRERRGSFRAWLFAITRNKVGDHIRKQKDRDLAFGGSDSRIKNAAIFEANSDEESIREDERQVLFGAALRLIQTDFKEHTWQAFWRATIEGQPISQIADELEMQPKAVRQAKYRVLKRLREEFGELLE